MSNIEEQFVEVQGRCDLLEEEISRIKNRLKELEESLERLIEYNNLDYFG